MTTRDQNGNVLQAEVKQETKDGRQVWGSTVWFGGLNGLGTNVRRYFYDTRAAARRADISNEIGTAGRVA